MSRNLFDLGGKKALVTGAGRGLGRACALALAEAGSDVALVARSADQLNQTADLVGSTGRRAVVIEADLTDIDHLPRLAARVDEQLGGLDILVNNAGLNNPQKAEEVTPEVWDEIMNINLKAAFFMSQAVGRLMIKKEHGGRIINMSSQAGSVALMKRVVYNSSKAALNMMTKCLAFEWAEHGILVNAVGPTFIETDLLKPMMADPVFRSYVLQKNLLGRLGTPEDVVGAVIYLASPAANLVTGQVLLVDAGWTIH